MRVLTFSILAAHATNYSIGVWEKNEEYNANSLDLHVNLTTELESSFLEAQLFAITVRLSFLFPSRASPFHHTLFISVANEVEVVQTAASFPTVCTMGTWQVKVASHKANI